MFVEIRLIGIKANLMASQINFDLLGMGTDIFFFIVKPFSIKTLSRAFSL